MTTTTYWLIGVLGVVVAYLGYRAIKDKELIKNTEMLSVMNTTLLNVIDRLDRFHDEFVSYRTTQEAFNKDILEKVTKNTTSIASAHKRIGEKGFK